MKIKLEDIKTEKLEKKLNKLFYYYENNGKIYTFAPIGYLDITRVIVPGLISEVEVTGVEIKMYDENYAYNSFSLLLEISTVDNDPTYRYWENGEWRYVGRKTAIKWVAKVIREEYV